MGDTTVREEARSHRGLRSPAREDLAALLDRDVGTWRATVALPHGGEALPLAVVTGARPGPTVWINGCLHGDEYLGPAAIAELLRSLRPSRIRGRVLFTPALNLGAVRALQREDPATTADWNRVWSADRARSEVPATVAWARDELLARSDVVLDLHSGGNRFLQVPFAVYPRVGGAVEARAAALAKAAGLARIWAHRGPMLEGALITAAARAGKSAVLLEIGGEGKAEPGDVRRMVSAVRGALALAGVVRGRPRFRTAYEVFTRSAVLRNRKAGRWARRVDPGARVRRAQAVGVVLDLLDHPLETVSTPQDGVVLGVCTYGYVPEGDYIAELAHGFHTEGPPS